MVFERDGAGKTPLEVSIKSLATDSPVVVAIWEVMENSGYEKIKEHFGQEETTFVPHMGKIICFSKLLRQVRRATFC